MARQRDGQIPPPLGQPLPSLPPSGNAPAHPRNRLLPRRNARVAILTAAIAAFTELLNHPRGQIVNRSTLLKEVETDTAALLEDLRDLDDLVLQFADSGSGPRFIQAWKQARVIVDAGHGPGEEEAPASPPPAS